MASHQSQDSTKITADVTGDQGTLRFANASLLTHITKCHMSFCIIQPINMYIVCINESLNSKEEGIKS